MRILLAALALALAAAPLAAADDPVSVSAGGDARGVVAVSLRGDATGAVAVSLFGDATSLQDACIATGLPMTPRCLRVLPLAAASVFGDATADKVAVSVFGHAYTYLLGFSGCDDAGVCSPLP